MSIFKKAGEGVSEASSSVAFLLGLLAGLAVISTIGFVILLVILVTNPKSDTANKAANVLANNNQAAAQQQPTKNNQPVNLTVSKDDHTRGSLKAKVTMFVFSDFQCPYCARFHDTVNQVIKNYGDKVLVVFKNFPLDSIHPNARPAANAAECVAALAGNDAYWSYIDKLFANQGSYGDEFFAKTAKEVGVSTDKFTACYQAKKYAAKIDADYQLGLAAGVDGTPASVINGTLVAGALSFDQIKTQIDAGLK